MRYMLLYEYACTRRHTHLFVGINIPEIFSKSFFLFLRYLLNFLQILANQSFFFFNDVHIILYKQYTLYTVKKNRMILKNIVFVYLLGVSVG